MFRRRTVNPELAARLADFGERLQMKREAQRPLLEQERLEREEREREEATSEAERWRAFLEQCEGHERPPATVLPWPRRESL